MKLHNPISTKAIQDLKNILDPDTFQSMLKRFSQQTSKQKFNAKNIKNQTIDMKTPSTVDTNLRKRGSAITKSMRPQSRSRGKVKQILISRPSYNNQLTVTNLGEGCLQQNSSQIKNDSSAPINVLNKKILTDRAVYFGNVELPYLHSSDAISSLYQRSKINDKQNPQPIINPSANISPHLLTNIKNLYLYYTQIDTLRQLGTGWSNLKSLTIMCSHLLSDLSGLSIFPSLQYLFVPHNNIRQISDLMYHSSLRCIDLQDNKIDLIDQIQYIYTVANLEWVDISQNPITSVKQKYRIICQNLGNKIQIQDNNKIFQYQMSVCQLEAQLFSYANIQSSCHLIKQINQQILKEQIKVGQFWRAVHNKLLIQQQQDKNQVDIQIVTIFHENQDEEQAQYEEDQQEKQENRRVIQLRVTPLTQYVNSNVSVDPLKKYFHNKIFVQTKTENQKVETSKINNVEHKQSKQIMNQTRIKRFAATQKLTSNAAVSEEKPRLNSVSMKKRLTKVSLPKNINFATATSSVLSNMKLKQELPDSNSITSPSGLKFLSKRKLLSKQFQQLPKA